VITKPLYRTGIRIIGFFAIFVAAAIYLSLGITEATAATIKVGGKSGFKTIARAVNQAKNGDTINIAPGLYKGGFKITRNVTINAELGASIMLGPKQAITVDGVKNVVLNGLVVSSTAKTGGKPHYSLVNIIGSAKVALRNCEITTAGRWGVLIKKSRGVIVENCDIHGSGEVGINLDGERIHLQKSTVTGHKFGVYIVRGNGIVVANNLFDGNSNGVYLQEGKVDLVGNTINGPGHYGIIVSGGDVVVAGNAVRRYQHGMYLSAKGQGIVAGNTLSQNTTVALTLGGPQYRVRANTISYNAGTGIIVRSEKNEIWPKQKRADITQNVVSSNRLYGVVVSIGAEVLLNQNLLENNGGGLLVVGSVVEALHNTIVLNSGVGINVLEGAQVKLTRNILANNRYGLSVHVDANLLSDSNVIYGHILAGGFQLVDANLIKRDWLPTLGGDDILTQVVPARDLRTASDFYGDPGFVKLGFDYRLRRDSNLLKRFKVENLPGAFPTVGENVIPTKN